MSGTELKPATKITTLGRRPFDHCGVVNPPVYHASTILFKTYQDFEDAKRGKCEHTTYGRYGSASTTDFASVLAELEGAHGAVLTASGLAAISCALTAFVKQGDHVLMADANYEPARRYCRDVLAKFGVETTFYDAAVGADVASQMRDNTTVVYLESPGSLTFEVQDVPAIAKAAKARGATVILDNTYAAPMLTRPYELGVDVSLYSASKYVSGHSDLIMGVVTGNEAAMPHIICAHHNLGACPGPDDVYLAQRGLRTLMPRLKAHEAAALEVAAFLKGQPEVAQVLHPALPECPGHEFWKRDFSGSNGLFSIRLHPVSETALAAMLDGLYHFGMGYSWGGYESLIVPFTLKGIRDHHRYPDGSQFLRLHIGLEDVDDLKDDLAAGFSRLRAHA